MYFLSLRERFVASTRCVIIGDARRVRREPLQLKMSTAPLVPVSPIRRAFVGLFYLLFCVVTLGIGTIAGWANKSPLFFPMIVDVMSGRVRAPQETFAKDNLTLLVLGCDEVRNYRRDVVNDNARSDMILLAKLDFATQSVSGVAIPRDLWVELPQDSEGHKINAYHAIGGKQLAEKAVEHVTGVEVDRTIVINFEEFQKLVDTVGGVDVFVQKDMKYTDKWGGLYIDLKAGRQRLNGYDAMCFVRFRKDDSDFERIKRQRDFMLAFKQSVFGNLANLPNVVEKASDTIGDGFSSTEMLSLGNYMRGVSPDSIRMETLPVVDSVGTTQRLVEEPARDMIQKLFGNRAKPRREDPIMAESEGQ